MTRACVLITVNATRRFAARRHATCARGRSAACAACKPRKISSERGWNADLLQHVPALVDDLEIDAAPTAGPRYTAGRGELRVVRDLELRHRIERGPQLAGG